MVRKYIILAVTAALLSPCLLTFADDDLQGQLDDVQTRMAEQSEKKAQAQMVIDNVSDKLYEIQKSLEAAHFADLVCTTNFRRSESNFRSNRRFH